MIVDLEPQYADALAIFLALHIEILADFYGFDEFEDAEQDESDA